MNKHRLLNILTDLSIKLAHSDIEAHILFKQFDDGQLGIAFTHFSDYYEEGNRSLYIFDYHDKETALNKFNHIKEVLVGERLVTDERNSDVSNKA
ncbi:hypothetical protein [Staphylococcus sp. GDB20D115P1]|jgi:hypothetical protein|uniref:hypothetical protein n=1 Tax=Staphylococcus sp. GDB20D115P1 TaxID=2804085 RepID=UPI001AEC0C07|nr:hypothetical protein [Staphylococcus sp. GDB20D115P1]HJG40247.1 hypothetical protein [Staphylococcus saprophyticus]